MIPINDAMIIYMVAVVLIAAATSLAWRSLTRKRLRTTYQQGHADGMADQITRYQRALRTGLAVSSVRPSQVLALIDAETGLDTGASMIGERFVPAPPLLTTQQWGPIDDFPAGLPAGLCEWVAGQLAAAAAAPWKAEL